MDKPQPQHRQAKTQAEQKSGIERIVQHYLESNPLVPNAGKTSELEIRFGQTAICLWVYAGYGRWYPYVAHSK
jgi:hypothetical protein